MPELDLLQSIDIEKQALVMLLMIPVVASILGIARHVIGTKSLGIYAPIVLTFSFYALGLNGKYGEYSDIWTGIRYGIAFSLVMIATSIIGTSVTKRSRMHYFPKIAINLSLVAMGLLAAIIFADLLGKEGFTSINAFALVMLASVAEQFTATLFKNNTETALLITLETIITSYFCYILIAWPKFQDIVLKYPYLVLLVFAVNYLVGKYKGLRFREYLRFREVLNDNSAEDQE